VVIPEGRHPDRLHEPPASGAGAFAHLRDESVAALSGDHQQAGGQAQAECVALKGLSSIGTLTDAKPGKFPQLANYYVPKLGNIYLTINWEQYILFSR